MSKLEKGCIQIYTGNGKGKTTAAIGQGIRSAGCGLKVYMVQFLKGMDSGELHCIERLNPDFQIFRFERPRGFFWTLSEEEKNELRQDIKKAMEFCTRVLKNSECDVLIMDEIMGVLGNKLVSEDDVIGLLDLKPENVEIIMTGRNVPEGILNRADLVTEMREIKHYYKDGVPARKGIEY